MFATTKKSSRRRIATVGVLYAIAICAASGSAYIAFADQAQPVVAESPATVTPVDLEQAFWTCDYLGTTYGLHAAPIDLCTQATAALKEQKFGGDFLALLEWWQQNKNAQHGKLAALESANASAGQ